MKYAVTGVTALAVLSFVGIFGSLNRQVSNAATPSVSVEAESGSLSNGAVTAADASASGGSAVKFAATQTSGVYTRPTGPNTVRYEDLATAGDGLREVLAKVPAGKLLTLPAGVFEFSNFTQSNGTVGVVVNSNTLGVAGSGIDKTIIRMVANTSTVASKVPPQSSAPATNQLYLMSMMNGTNQQLSGFTLEGTNQQHLYGGIYVVGSNSPDLSDMKVTGIPGDANTPPGETFGINIYNTTGMTGERIEVSGIRTSDGVNVGASPFGYNSASNSTLRDCYFHDNWTSTFTYWQTHDSVTYNTRSIDNGSGTGIHSAHGINHERSYNITHYSPTVKINHSATGTNAGYHMSMNNDLQDGQLTVYNPTYDSDSRLPNRFIIMSFNSYRGVPNKVVTKPLVYDALGNPLPAFAWAH